MGVYRHELAWREFPRLSAPDFLLSKFLLSQVCKES